MFDYRNKRRYHLVWLVIYTILFGWLTFLVARHSPVITALDRTIQGWLIPFTNPQVTKVVVFLTNLGSPTMGVILGLIVCITLLLLHNRATFLWGAVFLISGNLINSVVKHIVLRTRPSDKLVPQGGFSYPSGHTLSTGLLVMLLLALIVSQIHNRAVHDLLVCLGYLWIVVIALTRIYLHVHFPSDTIGAGLLLGIIWNVTLLCYPYHQFQ